MQFRPRAAAAVLSLMLCAPTLARADVSGIVRGRIVAGDAPAAGVAVTLSGEGTTLRTTTNADGRFVFARVPYGRYDLAAAAVSRSLEIASGGVVDLRIDLAPRPIASVRVEPSGGTGAGPVSVTTLDRARIAASPENGDLDRLIATVPGIVRFSYDEPVAHGFHGLTYELDGVPLAQGTAANFGQVVDPRTIDSLEIFTGAFPAEYGGSRQGAVVNIISRRPGERSAPSGSFSLGAGSYGRLEGSLAESFSAGTTRVFVSANEERSNRGLDSPTYLPQHDDANASDEFLRTTTALGKNDVLAFDASLGVSHFQIPIDTNPNDPNDPIASAPGTDDVQRETDSFFTLSYTHDAANGRGFTQIAPYYKYDRIVYAGDLARDLLGTTNDLPNANAGLRQDRHSTFAGLRVTQFVTLGTHALKAGLDADVENFAGDERIAYFPTLADGMASPVPAAFLDAQARRGSNLGAYLEDTWSPPGALTVKGGLRLDRSTGYVRGGQLSPRLEIDGKIGPRDVVHAYDGRLYAAPFLEDTRAAAVVVGGLGTATPAYDLRPERDSYVEFGLAHRFATGTRATVNLWKRDVRDVLDTTQLANTPIFAVYNNTVGIAEGVESRLDARLPGGDSVQASATLSKSRAGGISGGTFLFPPSTDPTDVTLAPEDHDQTFAAEVSYTKRFGPGRHGFATLEPTYGTGYPVRFQNGTGRLPPHLVANASIGRDAESGERHALGYRLDFQNFTNAVYVLKIANGFNTTQYGEGFRADLRITAPL